ncbi:MAG: hypothetical protein JWN86_1605 [Planctomycetota bacterium]|nr:hypothetical protein [Planctomycetota bacterium]
MFTRKTASWVTSLVVLLISSLGVAQEPDPKDDRAARLEEMTRLIKDLKISDTSRPSADDAVVSPQPLHRWNDPTRDFSDGTLWAFGSVGRPVALGTMELYGTPKGVENWSIELIAVAPGPILGSASGTYLPLGAAYRPGLGGPLRWTPKGNGVEMSAVPGGAGPGISESERLRQMKTIASRITAKEIGPTNGDDQQFELRLLPRPIHRYDEPKKGLLDGAIFVYAYGTNPELLAFVEARSGTDKKAFWSVGFARISRAKLAAQLDGKDVWNCPYTADAAAEEPYHIVRTARVPKE